MNECKARLSLFLLLVAELLQSGLNCQVETHTKSSTVHRRFCVELLDVPKVCGVSSQLDVNGLIKNACVSCFQSVSVYLFDLYRTKVLQLLFHHITRV